MKALKKILIVDDDIDILTVIETILTKEGYEVHSAMDKNEGLEKLRNVKPDLAILDVMMTKQYEGFELAMEMLNNPEFKDIPFIIQSSIDIMETTNPNVQEMARELRKVPKIKAIQVLLIKNVNDGSAGIDYRAEDGKTYWFPVRGFLKKPVEAQKLLPEIKKIIK
jgi:CheY-like chemotaxis protein